jgi:hypothetical protein
VVALSMISLPVLGFFLSTSSMKYLENPLGTELPTRCIHSEIITSDIASDIY